MREIDLSNLKRYTSGKYTGKIDWGSNIGEKIPFVYNDQKGEIEIVDYIKSIPQGTITVKYGDIILPMKTNNLMKCGISNLIKRYNYDYLYDIGKILETKYNTKLIILNQIKLLHTNYYERGYTVKCLSCNHEYNIREVHISSCPMCSDRVSYPEKFIHNLLIQIDVRFEVEKVFDWSGLKRYDIYIPNINTIVEVHGGIHYEESYYKMTSNKKFNNAENLRLRKQNDKKKYKLALKNNISNYIIIDARKSDMNYIKKFVLSSDLNKIYNLSNISWLQCHEYACKTIVKQISMSWNNNMTLDDISNKSNADFTKKSKIRVAFFM